MVKWKPTWSNLAYNILKENGAPMNYREITEKILKIKKGVVGKTPQSTLRVQISLDSRFIKIKKGVYGLSEW